MSGKFKFHVHWFVIFLLKTWQIHRTLWKKTSLTNILPVQALFLMSIHLEQSNFPSTKEGIWEVGKPRAASSFVNLLVNFLFCLQVRYYLEIHFVALVSICRKSLYKMMFWKMSLVFILPSQNRAIFVVSQKLMTFVKVTYIT